MKPISYKQEMGDTERLLCPEAPQGFHYELSGVLAVVQYGQLPLWSTRTQVQSPILCRGLRIPRSCLWLGSDSRPWNSICLCHRATKKGKKQKQKKKHPRKQKQRPCSIHYELPEFSKPQTPSREALSVILCILLLC